MQGANAIRSVAESVSSAKNSKKGGDSNDLVRASMSLKTPRRIVDLQKIATSSSLGRVRD
jgi:hypothetical protein